MSGIHETASNIDTGRGISLNLLLAISYQENFEDIKRGNKKSECMSDYCLRHEAKIKNMFVSPYPTDPVKIGRLKFFCWKFVVTFFLFFSRFAQNSFC
jgi:hypothetical protein